MTVPGDDVPPSRQQVHQSLDDFLDAHEGAPPGHSAALFWGWAGHMARALGVTAGWDKLGREYADKHAPIGPNFTEREWARARLLRVLAQILWEMDQPDGLFHGVVETPSRPGQALSQDVMCLLRGWPGGGDTPAILHQRGQPPGVPDRDSAIRIILRVAYFRKGASRGKSLRAVMRKMLPDLPENTWRGWDRSDRATPDEKREAEDAGRQSGREQPPHDLDWSDEEIRELWEVATIKKPSRATDKGGMRIPE